MAEPDDLLTQAEAIWRSAERNYRDSLLQVGRLLHEFIVEQLRCGDGVKKRQRLKAGFTREVAIKKCAAQLGIPTVKVMAMIRIAMTADLLGQDGFGAMGWTHLHYLAAFVERVKLNKKGESTPLSATESWRIKPEYDGTAQDVFRRVREEKLSQRQTFQLIGDTIKWPRRPINSKRIAIVEQHAGARDLLESISKVSSPRDLAEILFEAIETADDPKAVAAHLQRLLAELPVKKKKVSMAY